MTHRNQRAPSTRIPTSTPASAPEAQAPLRETLCKQVALFLEVTGLETDDVEARALTAALAAAPDRRGYESSSDWFPAALERGAAAGEPGGLDEVDVAELLSDLRRVAHAAGLASACDVALQLTSLELLRRLFGGLPRTVELPEPRPDERLDAGELRDVVVEWEARSYRSCLGRSSPAAGALLPVIAHLAEVDGLPVRFDRLEPAALALWPFEPRRVAEGGPPATRALVSFLLGAATLYEALVAECFIDLRTADRIVAQLRALALGHSSPERAA